MLFRMNNGVMELKDRISKFKTINDINESQDIFAHLINFLFNLSKNEDFTFEFSMAGGHKVIKHLISLVSDHLESSDLCETGNHIFKYIINILQF